MTSWDTRINSHPVRQVFDEVIRALQACQQIEGLDAQSKSELRRIHAVVSHVQARVERARPELIPLASLEAAAGHLRKALQELSNFQNDRTSTHLQIVNGYIDDLLLEAKSLPSLESRQDARLVAESAERLIASLEAQSDRLRQQLTSLSTAITEKSTAYEAEIQTLRDELSTLKTSADGIIAELRSRADSTISQLTSEITDQKTRLDSYFEQQQTSHRSTVQDWHREFTALLSTVKQQTTEATDDEVKKIAAYGESVRQQAETLMDSLRALETQAREITGVAAAAGVTGSYVREAREQKLEANVWRRVASVLLFLIVAGAIITTLWSPLRGDPSTAEIIEYGATRVPVILALAGVFTYAAQQSAQHRARERRARRRAMELTAFRPFIGELPTDIQHKLIEETTRKYFRGDEDGAMPDEIGGT